MTGRRLVTVVLAVGATGALLAFVAAAPSWGHGLRLAPSPLPAQRVSVRGGQVAASVRPLALAALAGLLAMLAVRRRGRLLVALVVAALGVAVGAACVVGAGTAAADTRGLLDRSLAPWPWVGLVGALLTTAGGVAAAVTVATGRWPEPRGRYERPATRPADRSAEMWDALDRGEDPTAR